MRDSTRLHGLAIASAFAVLSLGLGGASCDKKSVATAWLAGHHDNDFAHLWCAAPPGAQEALVASEPETFFRPPYVGHRGWLGVRLDGDIDWDEMAELLTDAYRTVAPKTLAAKLNDDK